MASSTHEPRPADIAIAGSRMLSGLLRRIWKRNYRQLAPGSMGTSLILMKITFRIIIATADGDLLTATKLARDVHMPPATVKRYVDVLVKHHRVKLIPIRKRGHGEQSVLVANLDHLDHVMTLEHLDASVEMIETCLNELLRLRPLLMPQLVANGKKQAAE